MTIAKTQAQAVDEALCAVVFIDKYPYKHNSNKDV